MTDPNGGRDVHYVRCIYCLATVLYDHGPPANLSDDDAWLWLAREHAPDCEWIRTRAHRLLTPST